LINRKFDTIVVLLNKNGLTEKRKNKDKAPTAHNDLSGFNIRINEFGEMERSIKIEEVNKFLDQNVQDKKLLDGDNEEE
jgi:hypothetical protein